MESTWHKLIPVTNFLGVLFWSMTWINVTLNGFCRLLYFLQKLLNFNVEKFAYTALQVVYFVAATCYKTDSNCSKFLKCHILVYNMSKCCTNAQATYCIQSIENCLFNRPQTSNLQHTPVWFIKPFYVTDLFLYPLEIEN